MEITGKTTRIFDAYTVFGAWPNRPANISRATLTATLDRHHVTRALTICAEAILGDCRAGNARAIVAAKEDARLVPVPVVNPSCYPGCLEEVGRMLEAGRRLLATFPETQDWTPQSLSFRPVIEALDEGKAGLMAEATRPGTVSGLVRALEGRELPLVLIGVNYRNLGEALAAARAYPRLYLETHLLAAVGGLERCLELVGEERVLFGSGAPLGYFSSAFLRARFATLTAKQVSRLLHDNTAMLLEELGCR